MVGDFIVPNRVWMAPLTRNRANSDGTQTALAATYYNQRSAAGLILTEATQISPMGKGYINTPGIYTDAQVESWKPVVRAVHAGGGRIFCQLWHVGRISHTSVLPDGAQPVSSSAVRADAQVFTEDGMTPTSEPRALTIDEIQSTIADYRHAAQCALDAGFDGVEIHSANGYLLDQFLQDGANQRTDRYGGSIDNRIRLLDEVVTAVCEVWESEQVGVRLAPLGGDAFDIHDSDSRALFTAVYEKLSGRDLAYLHVVEEFPGSEPTAEQTQLIADLRSHFDGTYIANGGFDAESASNLIASGEVAAVTFGRPFIANPDLPERFRRDAECNEPDSDTFYGGGAEGYTDYPFLDR